MKRRSFLRKSAAASTLPILIGGFPIHTFGKNARVHQLFNMAEETDRVLVLVQLNGGNDGLNMLIPLDQYSRLKAVRPKILPPENKLHKLQDDLAFHHNMEGMQQLYYDHKLAVIQSVGYPNPNFSHFRSTDIWTSASPATEVWDTGWLGRFLEEEYPGYPEDYPNADQPDPPAITIGSIVSTTCQGEAANLCMAITDPDSFTQLLEGGVDVAPNTPYGHELTFLRLTMQQTNDYLEVIQSAASKATNLSDKYPEAGENRLADELRIVSRLIAGGLKTRVYIVNLGGFDTHANQVSANDILTGNHANLLARVSEAIEAFQDDLKQMKLEDRVVGMTFSEFGRRIKGNDSFGTDHGSAAPMMVFGTNVNGQIFGDNPDIPGNVSPGDSLPMQFDFRSIYGSVLMDWFNVPEQTVKDLLFEDFQHVPVIKIGGYFPQEGYLALAQNYPNPFTETTRIRFQIEKKGRVQIRIFDASGRSIAVITDQDFEAGEHELEVDRSGLAAGTYYYRMQYQDTQKVKLMQVL